jgi:ATP-dependent RNA helicase DDX46/PRP5
MIKALEKAGQVPAPELVEMVAAFKEKVSKGEARYSSNGFDGKGFTFDATEMSEAQKNQSLQRKAYDVEQGIEEKNEEEEEEGEEGEAKTAVAPVILTAFDRARAIATSLCFMKALPVPDETTATSSGAPTSALGADGKLDSRAAMARAKLIASQLASGKMEAVVKEVAHFSEELEINDYPPQVRRYIDSYKVVRY